MYISASRERGGWNWSQMKASTVVTGVEELNPASTAGTGAESRTPSMYSCIRPRRSTYRRYPALRESSSILETKFVTTLGVILPAERT